MQNEGDRRGGGPRTGDRGGIVRQHTLTAIMPKADKMKRGRERPRLGRPARGVFGVAPHGRIGWAIHDAAERP